MFRGIVGYYQSILQKEKLADVLQRYTVAEDRNIYRLKLRLSRRQIDRLICRLWEIDHTFSYRYYFFNKNCTTMFVNLVNFVLTGDQELKERDILDLPLNVGSELYRKGIAEFVYPEYWSISRQAAYAAKQNKQIKEKIIAYFRRVLPGGQPGTAAIAGEIASRLEATFSTSKTARMEAYREVYLLYTAALEKLALVWPVGECASPSSAGTSQVTSEYYTQGKLLLKYFMNAAIREKYFDSLEKKKTREDRVSKRLERAPLVDTILKLRYFLGQHQEAKLSPIYDEIEREFTRHIISERKNRTFDCGYSLYFLEPRLTFTRDRPGIVLGNTFRTAAIYQEMGDNSVFSLGYDTKIEFLKITLSAYQVLDKETGRAPIGTVSRGIDSGWKFLEYEKILIDRKRGSGEWFNNGFGFTLVDSYRDKWRGIERDVTLLNLRYIVNIFEQDDFVHFLNIAVGTGYSYRKLVDGEKHQFLDILFRCNGKFHLFGSSRNALRIGIRFKPRITFTRGFMLESRVKIEIDWSQGARSNTLFTTGIAYAADAERFVGVDNGNRVERRSYFYTTLRFKGKLWPGWLNFKRILNKIF